MGQPHAHRSVRRVRFHRSAACRVLAQAGHAMTGVVRAWIAVKRSARDRQGCGLPASAFGFGGQTQAFRFIAGRLKA
jgi:hypothetical protein